MNKHYYRYYTYIQPVLKFPIIKTYGLHILTLATMIIFLIFAIKPTVETILVLQKKIADSQSVLSKINQKSTDLSQAKENFQNLDLELKSKIHKAVPAEFDIKGLIQTLEEAAQANQASISALQIQPVIIEETIKPQKKTLSEINFTYNVEGSYLNLLKLLQKLQQSPRVISLDNLIINKSAQDSNLMMSVSGKAYFLK